jgi:hypothetical protein
MARISIDPDQARARIERIQAGAEQLEATRDGPWTRLKSDWDRTIGASDEAANVRDKVSQAFGRVDEEIQSVLHDLHRLAAWDAKLVSLAQEHEAEIQGILDRMVEEIESGAPDVVAGGTSREDRRRTVLGG